MTAHQKLLHGFAFADATREQRDAYVRWAAAEISGVTEFLDPVQHDRSSVQYRAAWQRFQEEAERQRTLMAESVALWEEFRTSMEPSE